MHELKLPSKIIFSYFDKVRVCSRKNNLDVIRSCYILGYKISGPLSFLDETPPFHYCQYNQYLFAEPLKGLDNIFKLR